MSPDEAGEVVMANEGDNMVNVMHPGGDIVTDVVGMTPETMEVGGLGEEDGLVAPGGLQLTPGTVLTLEPGGQLMQMLEGEPEGQLVSLPLSVGQYQGVQQLPTLTFDSIVIQEEEVAEEVHETGEVEDEEDDASKKGKPQREMAKLEKPVGRGPYPCSTCGQKFDSWPACKRHVKGHQLDRRFRCSDCGATYNMERNLMLHMAGHQTGTKLVCPQCGKTFSRQASLRSHLSIHEEEDSLACPQVTQHDFVSCR